MQRYVEFVVRYRVPVVLAVLLVTALLATQLPHLRLEIGRRANMPQQHPYVQIQNRTADLFGGEAIVIIGIVVDKGTVFSPAILAKVHRITEGLVRTPSVIETSLFSLSAPYVKRVTSGADGVMEVNQLMPEPPTAAAEVADLRNAVLEDKLFRDNLVSADETATVIVVEFDDRMSDGFIAARVEELIAPERGDGVTFALAGAPVLRHALREYTALVVFLLPVAVLVIGLIHYEAFRTLQAMLLPLVTALLSVVWALGIMGALRLPMDTWSAITPVVVLAIAAGHAVQILKRYYEEYALCGDTQTAVVRSITAVGPVMLTAGCIASAGFASLASFGVTSVRVFGLLLASGILSALIIEMTFTPACRSLLPAPKRRELQREEQAGWLDAALDGLGSVVVRWPRAVLIVALCWALASVLGVVQMRVDNSFRAWFAPTTRIRTDDALLNAKLPGTATLRLLIEGDTENVLYEPSVLSAISDLEALLENEPDIGGVSSIADHVKRMHRAMNDGDQRYHAIPESRDLIAQYLLLYGMAAGPDGLSAFVDAGYRNAIIRALSKTDSAAFSRHLIERLHRFAAQRFDGLPVRVGIAGGTLGVQTAMNDVVVREKIVNMIQVSCIIFLLSGLVLRSLVGGLFVLMPLALAVAVNLGVMGWSGVWLDMTTAAFTAMGVSVGADFAIYLIFRIREQRFAGQSLREAIRHSLRTSGKAVFFVSSAVTLGYLVLLLAGFSVWTRLGLFTALIIAVSALATLTVIPALALVVRPRFLERAEQRP
jgi:predicted RND superfamily exporter protein